LIIGNIVHVSSKTLYLSGASHHPVRGCIFGPPDFVPIKVAVAQLPNRWVIATIGVIRAVVSTSVATANPEGIPNLHAETDRPCS
jgi:hypothetical protein